MSLVSSQLRIGGFLAVQFAFQPFLTRWFVDPATIKSSIVLMCELVKLVTCVLILGVSGSVGPLANGEQIWTPSDTLWSAGPPALTYTAQNLLTQTAYQNLDGMTFNVINQTKILFNALFVFLVMGDGQSLVQMAALGLIFAASVLVSFGDSKPAQSAGAGGVATEDFLLGATCCFAGSALSGLGSAVSELILVRKKRDTLVFSAELAALSALSVAANLALDLNGDGGHAKSDGLFTAWTVQTWVPVIANSLGGIAVGAVTKYVGSVRKGFAITLGLVLSAVLRVVVTGRPITLAVALAVPLASVGILLHMSQPRQRREDSKKAA